MTWNILARCLFDPDEATWKGPKEAADWANFRLWRTLEEVIQRDSDVICLQEIDAYEEIKPYLHALGYTSVFCPKFMSPCLEKPNNIGPDGSAIFYRKDKFNLVNMCCANIQTDTGMVHSQVYVIVQLEHKKLAGRKLTLVCLHLKSSDGYADVRAKQIDSVMTSLQRHVLASSSSSSSINSSQDDKQAIVICGDFNGGPEEKFYERIVGDHTFGDLVDSYSTRGPKEATFHVVEQIDANGTAAKVDKTLDFQFYTKMSLELTEILELPPKDEQSICEQGLPNLRWSSDHISLVSSFKFV